MTEALREKAKKVFLGTLKNNEAHVADACKAAKIGRTTAYKWKQDDADFEKAWTEIEENIYDDIEDHIKNRAKKNDIVLMFYAKTKMKHRGYIERSTVDHLNNGKPFDPSKLVIKVKGQDGKESKKNYNFVLDGKEKQN
jgi:hypothetical protein